MYKLSDIKSGDRVKVSRWAGEAPVLGVVDYTEKDIKNGLPGVNYTTDNGEEYWCYLDQVLAVYPKAVAKVETAKSAPETKKMPTETAHKIAPETKKMGGIKDKVAAIITANQNKTKKEIVAIIMQEMAVKENTANQYYYKSKG